MITVPYAVTGWGMGGLGYEDGRLVHHDEPTPGGSPVPRGAAPSGAEILAARLRAYLLGQPDDFADVDCGPAIQWAGLSKFEAAVVWAVRDIPSGETASYGEVAAHAGHPGAARAVGTACGRGVLSVIVPYHRVIRSDGHIGDYGEGEPGRDRKARLLALEAARAQ
jgi:methylated-DNA-[protein]-cysteine S-methyltransferase